MVLHLNPIQGGNAGSRAGDLSEQVGSKDAVESSTFRSMSILPVHERVLEKILMSWSSFQLQTPSC